MEPKRIPTFKAGCLAIAEEVAIGNLCAAFERPRNLAEVYDLALLVARARRARERAENVTGSEVRDA